MRPWAEQTVARSAGGADRGEKMDASALADLLCTVKTWLDEQNKQRYTVGW